MEKITKFVIISIPRTKSNAFIGFLNSNKEIDCHYEAFHKDKVFMLQKYLASTGLENCDDTAARDRDCFGFLRRLYLSKGKFSKAVGFKIFPGHNASIMDYCLQSPHIKPIILKRNHVFSYTSLMIASRTQQWGCQRKDWVKTARVRIDPKQFFAYAKKSDHFFKEIEAKIEKEKKEYLTIYGEDINRFERYEPVWNFLGVQGKHDLKSPFVKQNPNTMAERIENYEEFVSALKGSPYENYIEQDVWHGDFFG